MDWVSDVFFWLLFTSITGSMLTVFWILVRKLYIKTEESQSVYRLLRFVMLGYTVPIAYMLLKWKHTCVEGSEGWLFVLTPGILSGMKLVCGIWFVGLAFFVIRHLSVGAIVASKYKQKLPATQSQQQILQELCRQNRIRRKIILCQSYQIVSPCNYGLP